MGQPADYLPGLTLDADINALLLSVGLSAATTIRRAAVTAQYHTIYFITLPPSERSHGHSKLVLRVSARHLPEIKTKNEVGVMLWLAKHTTVPVADVIAYDATEANPIRHEHTLLSRTAGVPQSDIYDVLDEDGLVGVVDQLIDILCQLHAHAWDGIGGLNIVDSAEGTGQVALARVLDESFWQTADVKALWPAGETVATLNIRGPHTSYVDFISAQVRTHMRLVRVHDKLASLRNDDTLSRLEALANVALPRALVAV